MPEFYSTASSDYVATDALGMFRHCLHFFSHLNTSPFSQLHQQHGPQPSRGFDCQERPVFNNLAELWHVRTNVVVQRQRNRILHNHRRQLSIGWYQRHYRIAKEVWTVIALAAVLFITARNSYSLDSGYCYELFILKRNYHYLN